MTNTQDVRLHSFEAALQALIIDYRAIQQERDQLKETIAAYDRWLTNGVYSTTEEFQDMIAKRDQLQRAVQEALISLRRIEAFADADMDKVVCIQRLNAIWQTTTEAITALNTVGVK